MPGSVTARCYREGGRGCEESDDEDGVGHGGVTVWFAGEVIRVGRRARPGFLAVVGGVARGGSEGRAVPVGELVGCDVGVYGPGAGVEGGDVGFSHLEKAIVRPRFFSLG